MSDSNGRSALGFWLCLALYLGFALPLVSVGAGDIRLAGVFSVDEADIAAEVRRLYAAPLLTRPSFKYGAVFYAVPVLWLKVLGLLVEVNGQMVVVGVRLFCTLAGAGCLWMTYRVGRMVFGWGPGVIAAFLLCMCPVFLRWSVEGHPDLPQLFCLLGALYFCCLLCRVFRWRWVVYASGFAALGFGIKYAGVFLLPVILLAVLLPGEDGELSFQEGRRRLTSGRYLVAAGLVPVVFGAVFAVTNPYAVLDFGGFVRSLAAEKEIMAFGHRLREGGFGGVWLGALVQAMGKPHAVALCGALAMGVQAVRRRCVRADVALLAIWMGIFLSYLIVEVNLRRARHLLPVLPCALVFAGCAYWRAGRWLKARLPALPALVPGFLVVFFVLSWSQVSGAVALFHRKWTRVEGRVELTVGRWLERRFSEGTTILYDAYAYVPPVFPNVFRSFGMNYPLVAHFEPEVLVVRSAIEKDYTDLEDAGEARMGEDAYLERHYFYTYLRAGRIPEYELFKDFGSVSVYRRMVPGVQGKEDRRARWQRLVNYYLSGRAYRVMEAHRTMGDLHASMGAMDLAEQEYARARESRNYAFRLYQLGCGRLAEGKLGEGRRIFDEILAGISSKPGAYRAAIRRDMGVQFFRAGFYGEAAAEARAALALKPDFPEAAYDLGAFCLALGMPEQADSAYAAAVGAYGVNPEAAEMLRGMVREGVAPEGARRVLHRYFGAGQPSAGTPER